MTAVRDVDVVHAGVAHEVHVAVDIEHRIDAIAHGTTLTLRPLDALRTLLTLWACLALDALRTAQALQLFGREVVVGESVTLVTLRALRIHRLSHALNKDALKADGLLEKYSTTEDSYRLSPKEIKEEEK